MAEFCSEAYKKMNELTDNYIKEYNKRRILERGIKDIEDFLFDSLIKQDNLNGNICDAIHKLHLLIGDKN